MFNNKSGDAVGIFLIALLSLTAVQIAFAGPASSTACGTVTGDLTLTADLVNDSTCFTVTSGFLTLDCNGHSITYNSNKNMSAYGINVTGVSSVVIQNCVINANVSNTNNTGGILLDSAQSSIVRLNTIRATGLLSSRDNNNYGIFATRGSNNDITQNTINITGKGNNNFGIYSLNEYDGNISANTFYVNGTQGNDGIHLSGSNTTDISGNTINAQILNGTGNDGISLITSSFNYLSGNTITTGGTSSNEGINLFSNSNNNTVRSNTITTNGSSNANHGIDVDSSSSNLVTLNTISTQGSRANFGIEIADHATLNIVTSNTISTNSTSNSSGDSNNIGIGLETNVTYTNISNNTIHTRGFGNSNWGVEIYALSAVTVSNFNNIFNNIIITNGTNTNHGINVLSSQHNMIFNNNITTSGVGGAKNYGIFISGSSINSSSNNISNNTIRTNGIFDSIGIHVMQSSFINIYDNNITTASPTGSDNYGIFLNKTASNSTIYNNTIKTGGSFNNVGIYLINDSRNNKIESNIISTRGTTSSNFGIFLRQNSSNTTIRNNTITTFGTFDNFGIHLLTNVENTQIISNNISSNGSTSENVGIFVKTASHNTTITNNTITTYGTFFGYGIWINESQPTFITHNAIRANGSQNYNSGINLEAGNATIDSNSIITFGTDDNDGIDVLSGSSSANITNNHINASGSTTVNAGVYIEASSDGINVINNTIIAGTISVSDTSYGIYTKSTGNNISYNRVISTGTTLNEGIGLFTGSSSNYVSHNTINATGSAGSNVGLDFYSTGTTKDNVVVNNSIITGGTTTNYGVWIETGSSSNNITGLSISTSGTSSHGIFSDASGNNNIISNSTINITDASSFDIMISGSSGIITTANNITLERNNVTFSIVSNNGTSVKAVLQSEAPSAGVPASYSSASKYLNITNTTARSSLLLNISYKDSEVSGINENTLGIYRYNLTNWTNSSFYLPLSYGVDTSNNYVYATIQNFSTFGLFGTNDSTTPQVSTLAISDTVAKEGVNISITVNVTDETLLDNVQANITLPNGTSEIFNMSNTGDIYSYGYTVPSPTGTYTITILATDTAGNLNNSVTTTFSVVSSSPSSSPGSGGGGGGSGYVSNPDANPVPVLQPANEVSPSKNTAAGQGRTQKENITESSDSSPESENKIKPLPVVKKIITSSEFNIFIMLAVIAALLVVSIITYQYIKRRRSSIW